MENVAETELRKRLIEHILMMKQLDQDYARAALIEYDRAMPWLELKAGVKAAMGAK